jgi:hypothetical protein
LSDYALVELGVLFLKFLERESANFSGGKFFVDALGFSTMIQVVDKQPERRA